MKSGRILKNSFLINKKKWKFNKNNEKKYLFYNGM